MKKKPTPRPASGIRKVRPAASTVPGELVIAREQLRHSEERFRVAFHTSPDSININRLADGFYVDINEGFTRLTGYTREDVIGRSSIEINLWHDPADRQRLVEGLRQHGRVDNLKACFRMKDGAVRVGLMSAAVIQLQGEPHILSITRDIDDQERALERVRESEERFRELSQLLPQTIFETDREGRLTFLNLNAFTAFGFHEEDFRRGLLALDMIDAADRGRAGERMAAIMAGTAGTGAEYTMRRRDGSTFPAIIHSSPILRDGQVAGLRGIVVDISELRRTESALRKSESLLRSILRTAPAGIGVVVDRVFTWVSGHLCEMIGYEPAELLGRSARMLYPDDDEFSRVGRSKYEMIAKRGIGTVETRWRHRNGHLLHVLLSSTPLEGTDLQSGVVFTAIDISEKARLEERLRQVQKIEAIGQLAGGVAHDFNNLLTPIIGYSELLLLATPAADPRHGQLAEVLQAAERARKLVQQLLAFGRKQMVEMKVLDLNRLLDEFQRLLLPAMREDIELQIQPAASLGRVRGDPSQIEVALMNLAVNARDAMPDGGRIVIATSDALLDEEFCRQRPPTRPGAYVMVSVSDNGAGMSEEVQRHLFEPFFTTKALGRGTGLGLATVYGITKQHNGFIWVTSEPGRGSTFSIYLPRVDEPLDAERPAAAPAPASAGGETILLMEDNGTVRELVRTILQRAGYHVLAPATLEECRRLFAAESARVDLLLSDVVMPELNGPQLFRELAAQKPGLKVLFMSGYTDEIVSRHGIPEQDFAFIQKPITYHTLTTRVRTVLDAS